ncbi:MAG: amino acid kinase [Methanocellales archaeon]
MHSVIKIGGSLMNYPRKLKQLCMEIEKLSAYHKLLIIPGGGSFADHIRNLDSSFQLSPTISHKMALLAMDQYGLFLSQFLTNAAIVQRIDQARKERYAILLPSQSLLKVSEKILPHSWDVTSDSIACYIAMKIKASKLILVKDVNGIYKDFETEKKLLLHQVKAAEINKDMKCVDKMLPELLVRYKMNCCIVNGRISRRLRSVLEGKQAICTWIKYA